MAVLDSARRWLNDRMTSDENVNGTPAEKIRDLSAALAHLTPQEREKSLEHVRAYTNYYFLGHQRESIPLDVTRSLNALFRESGRLTAVDQARAVLQQYGGPPTRDTIEESLHRSIQERAHQVAPNRAANSQQTELSWTDLHPKQEAAQSQKVEQAHGQKQEQKQKRSQGQGMEISA